MICGCYTQFYIIFLILAFLEMKTLCFILFACTAAYFMDDVRADWDNWKDNDEKLFYVIDLVNEIEIKLKCIEDMTMRLNILEVFVYLAQKDVDTGLDKVDNWYTNQEMAKNLTDMTTYRKYRK